MTSTLDPSTRPAVPTRYAEGGEWAERFARPMFQLAGPGARMKGAELEDLKAGLMRRDEVADRFVRAVREDHVVTMPQFRAALADGVGPDAPAPLAALFAELEARPD